MAGSLFPIEGVLIANMQNNLYSTNPSEVRRLDAIKRALGDWARWVLSEIKSVVQIRDEYFRPGSTTETLIGADCDLNNVLLGIARELLSTRVTKPAVS